MKPRTLGKTGLMVSEIGLGGEWLEHHASECIGCQSCEARCLFGVKISQRMTKAAELFGE